MPVSRTSQQGIVAVVVTIAMLALLAMAGLALDSGHLLLNKSRLQETVDAAALAAAKVLDTTGSQALATTAAQSVFDLNAANFPELKGIISGANLAITYSNTLSPFVSPVPAGLSANYVRVVASNFKMWAGFISLVGLNSLTTAASAVAGPSAPISAQQACDVAPIMVCGDPTKPPPQNYGFDGTVVTVLKLGNWTKGTQPLPGDFQLIQVGGPGGNDVRLAAAGANNSCLTGNTVSLTTKPGNTIGPTDQGFGCLFDNCGGPLSQATYPPDVLWKAPAHASNNLTLASAGTSVSNIYNYSKYMTDSGNPSSYDTAQPPGVVSRRVVAVPIANCTGGGQGQTTFPVMEMGCFFLLQDPNGKGGSNYLYGQYVNACVASGSPGATSGGIGAYKIVLHKDASSGDS